MSQVHFEQVTSWEGAKVAHERFVTDYNAQPHWAHRANGRRTLPLSEGRFAAKGPFSLEKWLSASSNRKESFAEIQKTEGKPCRALDQGEAIFTLNGSQGFVPSESRSCML